MSRLDAIKDEQKRKESGGYGPPRKWYVNQELLDKLGMKQYKAKKGTNFLRIIPPIDEKAYFGVQIFVHYDIGAGHDAYLCPKMMKKEHCPICEKREKLLAVNAEKDVLRAFSCFPPRYAYLVVDVSSEETEKDGVQLYDAPQTINNEILGLSKNRRTGEVIDISDPDKGKTLLFDRTGTGAQDTKYTSFELDNSEPIPDKWMEAPDIMELLHFGTEDEMLESLGSTSRPAEPVDATPAEEKAPAAETKAAPAATAESANPSRRRSRTSAPPVEDKPEEKAPAAAEAASTGGRRRIPRDAEPEVVATPAGKAEAPAEDDVRKRLRERLAARNKKE